MKKYLPAFALFTASTVFIGLCVTNNAVFDWVFARHQNPLSWYIRPLFIIPLCWFAYRHSLTGIATTVFALLTSMFWFPHTYRS
ncbi:hypothetical protein [Lonepinella sp. MS14437]|uniref:hypothetical protein n=1 Tax=Lonepinella sp. MS14437 TaxID=3003620 RepID=UPI0036DAD509